MTPQQAALLKAAIQADSALNSQPNTADGAAAIAAILNLPSNPVDNVWRTDVPVSEIIDAINWSLYTPNDSAADSLIDAARANRIMIKQMNLQLMLQGRDRLDTSKANVRAGLRDAVIAVPSGTSGASTAPGGSSGSTVLNACTRNSLRIESILSVGSATTGSVTAKLLGWEGQIGYIDVETARNS